MPGAKAAAPVRSSIWLVVQYIARFQYVPQTLDAPFATKALQVYLRELDPERIFFSAQDAARLQAQGDQLSQMLPTDDVSLPRAIASRHAELATQHLENAIALIDKGLDVGSPEARDVTMAEDAPFLATDELTDRWHKIVKGDWLQLKRAGKSDAEIRAQLTARYRAFERHVLATDDSEAVSRFLDAYAMASGEGSQYFAGQGVPFAVLSHLGVVISADADGPLVGHVSPSIQRLHIRAGDRLVGIAVDNGDMTYLDGWRATEVKSLLEGIAPDATVHLLLRRHDVAPGGLMQTVTLKVSAEPFLDAASLRMVAASGADAGQVAVITLPTFYRDEAAKRQGASNFESSSRDVQQLLEQAQQSGALGVVLDLRGNQGGSLPEAADVASLFVGKRLLWRSRNAKGEVEQVHGAHDDALWTGPLVVLIDHASAEGAELVASALQDNQRALVVGKTSTGAGNVANAVDLNRFARDVRSASNGMLKLTTATTFRASGENISGHGVVPDLELPLAPAFSSVAGPALVTFDGLPPMTLEPMLDLQGALPELRRQESEHAGKSPLSSGSRSAAYPDEGDLLSHVATILVDERRALFR